MQKAAHGASFFVEVVKFFDSESGKKKAIEVEKTVTTSDGQIWKIGRTRDGVDWAVPVGFPNNANPICRESEPEAYQELADLER